MGQSEIGKALFDLLDVFQEIELEINASKDGEKDILKQNHYEA